MQNLSMKWRGSFPACTEPALGLEGFRIKTRGAPTSQLPSQALRMANSHITLGKRVQALSNSLTL